jgi:hypothetical protein
VIRSALTGERLDDQGLTRQVRIAIALHNASDVAVTAEQDEGGIWYAQAVLAPGVAAFGSGATRQDAIDACNEGSTCCRTSCAPLPDLAWPDPRRPVRLGLGNSGSAVRLIRCAEA